jgi:hypothetical protein
MSVLLSLRVKDQFSNVNVSRLMVVGISPSVARAGPANEISGRMMDYTDQDAASTVPKYHPRYNALAVAAISISVVYFILVLGLRSFTFGGGWASFDARMFHFPVINYFLGSQFDFDYPKDMIAMFPGMHMFFAAAGRIFNLNSMEYNGIAAFSIQTMFGLLLLGAMYKLSMAVCNSVAQLLLLYSTSLSSSYTLYSWIWPTTELGSYAFYIFMLVILIGQNKSARTSIVFSILTAASMLFRQSNATLSLAFAANQVLDNLKGGRPLVTRQFVIGLVLPLLTAASIVGMLIYIWGGLVPPEARFHQPSVVNPVALAHMLALTGLIGWPFAIWGWRILTAAPRLRGLAIVGAVLGALLLWLLLPLNFDHDHGRWGSIVWSIEEALRQTGFGTATVCAEMAVGIFIWSGVVYRCLQAGTVFPEVLFFSLFTVSLMGQAISWQRYVEQQLLATLAISVVRSGPRRTELVLATVWFGLYFLVSIIKLLYSK